MAYTEENKQEVMKKIEWARDELNEALRFWKYKAEGNRSEVENRILNTLEKLESALKQVRY
jgi:ElaB/YqjD/DUF883 family membrane-anchored ribosome-binding protein